MSALVRRHVPAGMAVIETKLQANATCANKVESRANYRGGRGKRIAIWKEITGSVAVCSEIFD